MSYRIEDEIPFFKNKLKMMKNLIHIDVNNRTRNGEVSNKKIYH